MEVPWKIYKENNYLYKRFHAKGTKRESFFVCHKSGLDVLYRLRFYLEKLKENGRNFAWFVN